jgi:hypothetical protein
MQRSVDRAMQMQPRRTARIRDDLLYSAPSSREVVAAIADAGRRLVEGRLAPRALGAIAVRRNDATVTVTREGCDLAAIDNRELETVPADGAGWWSEPLTHGEAAIRCWPPALVSIGAGFEPVASLAEHMPVISRRPVASAIALSEDGSCVSIAETVEAAITAVEVAEHAARIEFRRRA